MVLLKMTLGLVEAVKEYQHRHLEQNEDQHFATDPSLDAPAVDQPISHGQVIHISKSLRDHEDGRRGRYHLDELLRGASVYLEPRKPRSEPTNEYKALMNRLRRQEEARAYERMINPPFPMQTFEQRFPSSPYAYTSNALSAAAAEEDEVTFADVNRQVTLIINVLLSVVACSVAIWMVSSHWSPPKRLALSMGGSGFVGVAEVVIYTGYLRRIKDSKETEKRVTETKEIVQTWVLDDEWKASGLRLRNIQSGGATNALDPPPDG
ncbi:MAG: hypothetical protein M4579_001428 [Chaenotheca gracillima]|nr:MAG: hypothetical protein M4579_001428 [Chaenotheca gracillima]